MSLKIVKLSAGIMRAGILVVVAIAALFAFYFVSWSFVNAIADNGLDPKIAEARSLAFWLPETSPRDPQAHLTAARYFEKTFEADDLARSLHEYELATASAPYDFAVWLALARARTRVGDSDGADVAYRRAAQLAPNYAAVKWAYGNFLLRLGDADRGFRLVAEAAGSDQAYRTPALQTTLQVFEGNPLRARQALGATPEVDAALTEVLAAQQRFPEAAASWARIANNEKFAKFSYSGGRLIAEARAANEFRIAASVAADLTPDGTERPEVGKLVNGGFEGGIKLRDSGPFEWNIAEGAEPRIGLSEGVLRTGRFSLFFTFNSFETANSFRPVTQLVAVEPAAIYEFSGFYRADLKTKAEFRWEITQAASGQQIAVTEPLTFAGDWTTFRVQFSVPATVDGIVVRFIRLNCGTGACPVAGRLVFDDLSLTKVSK